MSQLNRTLFAHLQRTIPADTLSFWKTSLSRQQENSFKKVNTPATNCTASSWRKDTGNAIDQIRRKRKQAAEKQQQPPSKQDHREEEPAISSPKIVTEKILIKNKAVFFGEDCQLPYLHSSDAISNLYAKKREEGKEELLFNPANTIDSSYMTSLKSLHIYHTSIDSLRQLGTGWCNLKQLSILHGRLCDLSGLSSFCSLQFLFLGFNIISSLSDLMFHPAIKCIDLQHNRIQQAEEIEYLATINRLEWVNLNHNPLLRVKQTRRIIQEKLGKMLEPQQYTRLQQYELEEMVKEQYLLSFQGLQVSNHLVKTCNDNLANDQVTFQNLYESYLSGKGEQSKTALDWVRYEQKHTSDFLQESSSTVFEESQEDIYFTPLIHFLSGKKQYNSILRKYFENRIFLNMKKVEKSQSPAHSLSTFNSSNRLARFNASTKLQREDACSLDKKQTMTTDLSSLEKGKRGRLSLGRKKKLLQRFENANPPTQPKIKFSNTFVPNTVITPNAKTFSLKRKLLKKPSIAQLQVQFDKKFSKTSTFKVD